MSHNDHLVDGKVKLARCGRCQAYVFLANASGIKAAADVAAADRDAYIAAVVDGRRTFDLLELAGRPHKLLGRRLGSPAPTYDENGAQTGAQGRRKVLVEHGCTKAMNMLKFEEIEQGPPPAPVTPGRHRGGPHPPPVHESGLYVEEIHRLSPAVPASRPRSEGVCGTCNRRIKPGELFWGIEHGHLWIYCEHEECP